MPIILVKYSLMNDNVDGISNIILIPIGSHFKNIL